MNEWTLVWFLPLKVIPSVAFMVCYAAGGRHDKWVRRYLGPVVFVVSNAILALLSGAFSWKILVLLVLMPILTLPYSKDRERLFYCSALSAAGLLCGLVYNISLGYLQAILTLSAGIFFTANHPTEAVNEEGIIALASVVVIPFMVS